MTDGAVPAHVQTANLLRTILRAAVGSLAVRLLGLAITFVVGVQLARALGPAGFGVYGTVMAIAALFIVPAQFGLPQLITRELSGNLARGELAVAKRTFVTFSSTVVAASIVLCGLGFVALRQFGPRDSAELYLSLQWGLLLIPTTALLNLGNGALRGLHRVVAAQVFDAVARPAVLLVCLGAAVSFLKFTASTAVALQAFAAFAALVICVFHLRSRCPPALLATPAAATDKRAWRGSATSMTLTEILRTLDGQYAVLLLGVIASQHEVGIFRVALSIAGFVGLPASLINVVLMPYLVRLYAVNDQVRLQMIAGGAAVTGFISISIVTLGLAWFGHDLIALAFGKAYVQAWAPLMLMSLAYVVTAIFGSAAALLNMCGEERTVTVVYFVGPIAGVALTVSLYPSAGISAAGAGLILSEAIKGVWMYVVARRKLMIDTSIMSFTSFFSPRYRPLAGK